LINQMRADPSLGVNKSFAIERTITEATGGHIAGLLTTAVAWQERTALAVEKLVEMGRNGLQTGLALTRGLDPLSAPSVLSGAASGLGGAVVVNINLPPGTMAETVSAVQRAVPAVVEGISRGLAQRINRAARANGNTMVS
jgi:hypothetical protein